MIADASTSLSTGLKPYPDYKESGLPWLGRVPGHWVIKRAKSIFQRIDQRSKTGKEELLTVSSKRGVVPRKTATVTMFKAESYLGYKLCWPGDLVINSLWAWAGGLGVSNHHGIISSAYGVYRIRQNTAMTPAFVHEVVRSSPFSWEFKVRSKGVWTSRLQLTDVSFFDAPIHMPPLPEQEAIVRFLDWANSRLERAIRAKRKVIALLNEQKQAIIHRTVTRGLDPSVPLKPSGIPWLGDIPQHWKVSRVKVVLIGRLTNGLFKRGDAFGSGVPLINVADIYSPDGQIQKEKLSKVQATPKEIETFRVLTGDLFFVRSSLKLEGTGKCAFVESIDPDTVFECHVVRARPDQRRIEPRFLAMFLSSWVGVNNTVSRANTVTMSTLPQGTINSLPIIVPPLVEQHEIVELVDSETIPLKIANSRLEREIELLREYRMRLVADVVTGKLDVNDVATRLPEESVPDTDEYNGETELPDEEVAV